MNTTFSDLGITKELTDALALAGITEPTAVQREVIPLIAAKKNIMFQSETGTGKTLAYLLPLIQRLETEENPSKAVKILIASPTYELAAQIKVQVQAVSKIKCALCIGGAPIARQIDMLKEKPQIVIGGAARLLELIHLKKLKADSTKFLFLTKQTAFCHQN